MANKKNAKITVQSILNLPASKAWEIWTKPEHIIKWNFTGDDWHCPKAENDLRVGGKFMSRMEAKDGSFGFDFEGEYDLVNANERIEYFLADGRRVKIEFREEAGKTKVIESFDPENENSHDMQKQGWQMILDNYKKYAESL